MCYFINATNAMGEAAMSEANAAVESVLSEEHSGGNSQKKRKYTHFTPQH